VAPGDCSAWLDEHGRLFLAAPAGFGIVHTQDMLEASRAVESGLWSPGETAFAAMPGRFGYVPSPQRLLEPAH
jgi:hypothetical protein